MGSAQLFDWMGRFRAQLQLDDLWKVKHVFSGQLMLTEFMNLPNLFALVY